MKFYISGDKTPRSKTARLFSVVWIIVGIVVLGIITGNLTSTIVSSNSPPPMKMAGKKVGTLRFRDLDNYGVTSRGGYYVRNEYATDFKSDIKGLLTMLRKDAIDGLLLDVWTLWSLTKVFQDSPWVLDLTDEERTFFLNETLRTRKEFENKSYGILIRNKDDYDYFKDFILDLNLRSLIFFTGQWVKTRGTMGGKFYSSEGQNILFAHEEQYFQYTIMAMAGFVAFVTVFGIFYELRRKKMLCHTEILPA